MGYEVFEKLCKAKGVTPYRVGKETGISTATLSSWKNGKYTPKADKLKIIADYFGVDVDCFVDVQKNEQTKEYFEDVATAYEAQQMFEDHRLRGLNHIKKSVDPQVFDKYYKTLIYLYQAEHPEDDYDFSDG